MTLNLDEADLVIINGKEIDGAEFRKRLSDVLKL